VLDAAVLLDAMQGYEPGDAWVAPPPERPFADEVGREPGRLRVALTTAPPFQAPVDPVCRAAAEEAARLLAGLGHDVEEATPAWGDGELVPLFALVWQVLPTLYVDDLSLLEPMNRAMAEAARETSSVDYVAAVARLRELARRVVAFWDAYDLLLTPTLAQPPPSIGAIRSGEPWEQFFKAAAFTPFTPIANVTGQPAVSVPLAWTDDGLPVGVQLVGRQADEATLFRVSAQLEQARPWRDRRPPLAS
jgi:amidase